MRILVFDDNPINQKFARVLLKDHDLTVVGSYDEASDLLTPFEWHNEPNPKFQKFDVVMTDLMVPASDSCLVGKALDYAGQEMPLGSIIALLALHAGVKKVAVVSDTNHHQHPASAALDPFQGEKDEPARVGDAVLYCTNYNVNGLFDAETYEQLDKYGKDRREKEIWAKDWNAVLQILLK